MRTFDYEKLAELHWDNEVLRHVAKIHEYKGRQTAFAERNPKEAMRLVEIAKIQSTESSNRLEGIVTTSARLRQLVQQKTAPRSRSEREIVGYRDVLNTIHENHEYIPVKPSYILQLHRDLMKPAGLSYGGHFKNVQNYISETQADGTAVTRFTPVAPYETESAIEAICAGYGRTLAEPRSTCATAVLENDSRFVKNCDRHSILAFREHLSVFPFAKSFIVTTGNQSPVRT